MTSKPDSVSTLGYHWTDHTGRPLEPQVHWNATGLFIEVQGECLEGKLTIGNIYRPPKCNNNNATIDRFTEEISPILTNMGKKSSNAIVAGDFNIDLRQIN